MQVHIRAAIAAAGLFALGACSPPASNPDEAPGPARYTLTAAELQGAGANNVYDAIQKLRPEFLRTRGTGTVSAIPTPQTSRPGLGGGGAAPVPPNSGQAVPVATAALRVYENDVLLESPMELRRIQTVNVIEVRFIPGPEAGVRYGTNHSGGVIFVKTT
jgi:hypothetical protein